MIEVLLPLFIIYTAPLRVERSINLFCSSSRSIYIYIYIYIYMQIAICNKSAII